MPRDDHHVPKDKRTAGDTALGRALSAWAARVVVPVLANRAARLEIAARRWVEDGGPRRRVVQARMAARPVSALVAAAGVVYLLAAVGGRRRS